MVETDWSQWHQAYGRPGSGLADRLDAVRAEIRRWLDQQRPGLQVRVVSLCSGDGRDLLGVLGERPDADRVSAVLVELDPALAARARESARGLPASVEVRTADAAASDEYRGAVPADLVLLCGIFGNIDDDDIHETIKAAPQLCAPGAEVVWTRHRRRPDRTHDIRRWFAETGFEEVAFVAPDDDAWSVGVHRLVGEPVALRPGQRWFTFVR